MSDACAVAWVDLKEPAEVDAPALLATAAEEHGAVLVLHSDEVVGFTRRTPVRRRQSRIQIQPCRESRHAIHDSLSDATETGANGPPRMRRSA
jgi:hypothetical protein